MNIYRNIDEIKDIKFPVVTIGGFDGVHTGHKAILKRLVKAAKENNGESVVITFSPHPRLVLYKESDFRLLTTDEEKIKIFKELNVDNLLIYPFTKEFSELSSDLFIENIIINKLHTRKLIIGYDHHFGNNRSGDISKLRDYSKKYGFGIEVISPEQLGISEKRKAMRHSLQTSASKENQALTISSTNIRKALYQGKISLANEMLGYEFNLTGKVVEGNRIGKNIGYPTANIDIDNKYKLIPPFGVYAVKIIVGGWKLEAGSWKLESGMLYIGTRPTINSQQSTVNSQQSTIEVNIFDFDEDIYNENITVYFIERIRDDIKFDSLEALKEQITNDKKQIIKLFEKYNKH